MTNLAQSGVPANALQQLIADLEFDGYSSVVTPDGDATYAVTAVPKAAVLSSDDAGRELADDDTSVQSPTDHLTPSLRDDATSASVMPVSNHGITLTESHLIALWKRSLFPIGDHGIVVFGIRGCLPVDYAGTRFAAQQQISLVPTDYQTMRCTIGQWRRPDGFSLFPGSTVPYRPYVLGGIPRGGAGVNQLGRGRYTSYITGWHKRNEGPNGHWALLQDGPITLQRTANDAEYDLSDRWEVGTIAGDDIHCAFFMGPGAAIPDSKYSSAGCQVIAGTVKKGVPGSERGPWAKFIEPFKPGTGAFSSTEYVLFDGAEVQQMIQNQCCGKTVILRFGSSGDLVKLLQARLSTQLGRSVPCSGEFDAKTFQAVLDFQASQFGPNVDDGIVGPETAHELGIDLPIFDFDEAVSGSIGVSTVKPLTSASSVVVATVDTSKAIAWGAFAEKKAGPGFALKVVEISDRLGCDPSNLMAVMAFESGESFSPSKQNAAGSGATGLIQFMPSTAISLGTSVDALASMTAIQQLDYVELYLKRAAGSKKLVTLSDVYMAVLYPAAIGQQESYVLFRQPSKAYDLNKGLDGNKDGVITKAEAASKVADRLIKGMQVGYRG